MKGLSFEEQTKWRKDFKNKIIEIFNDYWEWPPEIISPPDYYNYDFPSHKTEREVKQWELNNLSKCDILVVNLKDCCTSVGTIFEIATADFLNKRGANISIIGIGSTEDIHPWVLDCFLRIEDTIEDACEYIESYLLL